MLRKNEQQLKEALTQELVCKRKRCLFSGGNEQRKQ